MGGLANERRGSLRNDPRGGLRLTAQARHCATRTQSSGKVGDHVRYLSQVPPIAAPMADMATWGVPRETDAQAVFGEKPGAACQWKARPELKLHDARHWLHRQGRGICRGMQDPDQRAYVARVTRPDATGAAGRVTLFYAVLADTRQSAFSAIREAAQPGDYVELTEGRLSAETTQALGLIPGVAKPM